MPFDPLERATDAPPEFWEVGSKAPATVRPERVGITIQAARYVNIAVANETRAAATITTRVSVVLQSNR